MTGRFVLYLLVATAVTYLTRMLPMVLLKKQIKNFFLLSFLHFVPYTVLAVMTIPAVFYATDSVWSAAFGVAVAVVLTLCERSAAFVAVCSCVAVFAAECLMRFI